LREEDVVLVLPLLLLEVPLEVLLEIEIGEILLALRRLDVALVLADLDLVLRLGLLERGVGVVPGDVLLQLLLDQIARVEAPEEVAGLDHRALRHQLQDRGLPLDLALDARVLLRGELPALEHADLQWAATDDRALQLDDGLLPEPPARC